MKVSYVAILVWPVEEHFLPFHAIFRRPWNFLAASVVFLLLIFGVSITVLFQMLFKINFCVKISLQKIFILMFNMVKTDECNG